MREILFRGKRIDNGEWVYGDFVNDWSKQNTKPNKTIHNNIGNYAVIPETIGQYTGMKDKNGVKIFEHDIIDTPDRLIKVVWFKYNAQFDTVFIKYAHSKRITNFKGIEMRDLFRYDVIGNIHDNPELLERSTEE